MKIQKTIDLIKRCYNQPLIFHKLHSQLAFSLKSVQPTYEISDDWSKILIYSAFPNKISNQALESKIHNYLKKNRPPFIEKDSNLKLWCILYYLNNRPIEYLNNLIIFELVTNYLNLSDFTDGLIISIFSKAILSTHFGISKNKKFRNDSVVYMLEKIKEFKLSIINIAKVIPCYSNFDIEPPSLTTADIQDDLTTFTILECICYYAKYTKNTDYIKKIIPESPIFVDMLRKFITKEYTTDIEIETDCNLEKCLIEDLEILKKIKEAYEIAIDKKAFISKIIDYVSELK